MIVCIAEKPSVAGEIAHVLGANERKDGYYEGNGYQVTWTYGHLCELKEPGEYTGDWGRWNLHFLPMIPSRFGIRLKRDKGVSRQFDVIKRLFLSASEIVNCGDAGQEGELIQRWVLQMTGSKVPVKRLWISSLTEDAIRGGFEALKGSAEYQHLYEAGLCRAIGDWLLGMNATRLYTMRFGSRGQILSIGRVQTPTLSLVVKRDQEIENFKVEKYWVIETRYRDVIFSAETGRIRNEDDGKSEVERLKEFPFTITSVEKRIAKEAAPRLYDLTSLQVDCNKSYGMSAEETLRLIQSLYEKRLATYPRVDTTYLSEDIYPKVPSIMEGVERAGYAQEVGPLRKGKLPRSKKVFDDSKVTDHHAIIPTGDTRSSMDEQERKVYDKVVRRFLSVFYPECEKAVTKVEGKVGDITFKTTGAQVVKEGWRAVYAKGSSRQEEEEKDEGETKVLPEFVKGETGEHAPHLAEKETTPPKPYTEATLLRAMETAGKDVEDAEAREMLKENGIGRPSTRAGIIETLLKRGYIERGGKGRGKKSLSATVTGKALIGTIKDKRLKSAELTGVWEKKLREIEHGRYSAQAFLDELKRMVTEIVEEGKRSESTRLGVADSLVTEMRKASKRRRQTKMKEEKSALAKRMERAARGQEGETCPKCGKGIVIRGHTAYGCSRWKEGCDWRKLFFSDEG